MANEARVTRIHLDVLSASDANARITQVMVQTLTSVTLNPDEVGTVANVIPGVSTDAMNPSQRMTLT